jgi:hypothetical protein
MPSLTISHQNNCGSTVTDVMLGYWDGVNAPDWRSLGTIHPGESCAPQTFSISTSRDTDKWRLTFNFGAEAYASTGGWFQGGWKICRVTLFDLISTQAWEINGLITADYRFNVGRSERQRGTWVLNLAGPAGACTDIIAPVDNVVRPQR